MKKEELLGMIYDAEIALKIIRNSFGNDVEVSDLVEKAGDYLNSLWLKIEHSLEDSPAV